jgi:hypothetical protein
MGGVWGTYGKRRSVYLVLVGKSEGRRSLGRPRLSGKDNIKIVSSKNMMGCNGLIWFRTRNNGGFL